ncbi:MAG: nucleotidyltransferase substrate binding protein [Candidatus Caenarcaniphilales bacterium]|jgi:nucleotidyltransferase substrate binding protein (TIGR01987 family)|nr:nucleotidyltransferase substrate binding protein [Candidatus Caenarcaniphilales bacterium]
MKNEDLILGQISLAPLKRIERLMISSLENLDSDQDKAGAIQFFELAYELAWKTLRKVLIQQGYSELASSPRAVFRQAAQAGLIDDPELWFDFIEKRNETVHSYDEEVANDVINSIPDFLNEYKKLIVKLESLKQ